MNTVIPFNAKWTFTARRVVKSDIAAINKYALKTALSGDLVLAKVISIGSHKRVQLASGRNSEIHIDDYVVLCCGARYAPDQFEGVASIDPDCADMLAGGGVIGSMREKHGAMKHPTQLQPIGLLADQAGNIVNIERYGILQAPFHSSMKVIAVTGAAMNSGKTTSAFSLVNGLVKAGLKVAAIKITGTGAFGDFNAFADAGAFSVSDFTDAGMVTTYKQPLNRIIKGAEALLAAAQNDGADVAVVELGDGILQEEAAAVLADTQFQQWLSGLLFAAPDALSATAAIQHLSAMNLSVLAVSGLLTRSPLLCKEFAKLNTVPVYGKRALSHAETALSLIGSNVEMFNVA